MPKIIECKQIIFVHLVKIQW